VTTSPASVRGQLRELAGKLPPETIPIVQQMFADPHRANDYLASSIERDIAYGPDPRHRLDIHLPDKPQGPGTPVLLFVHGGGYAWGDKRLGNLPYHDHIGGWATRHGMVGITMNYRLAPMHPWPAGAEDVAAAVQWVVNHIGSHGGDPTRLIVAGHSAGATHVAGFLAGQGGPGANTIAGAVMMSGLYDVTGRPTPLVPIIEPYFGQEESLYQETSSIPGLLASAVPMLFTVTEFDGPFVHRQVWQILNGRFQRDGQIPPLVWVPGHIHASDILALGVDEDSVLEPALVQFINGVPSSRPAL
jgi:acetyl esterase/lipase